MLKLILFIIIIGSSSGAGYLITTPYENRIYQLQELTMTFKVLEAEMKYRKDPIPVLLYRIGKSNPGKAGDFFLKVHQGLKETYAFDFYSCWTWAIKEIYEDSALTEKDREVISEVGIELGKTDIDNQQSLFARVFSRLEYQVTDAEEEKKIKGKMYRSIGTAIGILVVIVLL
ncbi:MAG: hypothetical protein ACOX4P_04495 [Anaerovoracaceae bacterium]|jgi:stage III sporulation protein AB